MSGSNSQAIQSPPLQLLLFRLNRIGFAIDSAECQFWPNKQVHFYKDSPPSEAGHPTLFTNNVVYNPFKECSKHATESHADEP